MKIVIFGAGSIGCYVGGRLVQGGANVTFIGRERYKSDIKNNGLTLTHYEREKQVVAPEDIDFITHNDGLNDADIILLTVKSQDTEDAAKIIEAKAKQGSLIISFQNGVRNAERLTQALPNHSVLGGMVPYNVTAKAQGHFHCGTEGALMMQTSNESRAKVLVNSLSQSGEALKTVPDILSVQWGKLLINLNNGLNTLAGTTLHECLSDKNYRRVLAAQLSEALSVCDQAGISYEPFGKTDHKTTLKIMRLPNLLFHPIMKRVIKIDKSARSSMLDDLEIGRACEIDYLQGEIVTLAAQNGLKAPINQSVLEAVKDAFKTGQSPRLSGAKLLARAGLT